MISDHEDRSQRPPHFGRRIYLRARFVGLRLDLLQIRYEFLLYGHLALSHDHYDAESAHAPVETNKLQAYRKQRNHSFTKHSES